jgi:hypothetical protein
MNLAISFIVAVELRCVYWNKKKSLSAAQIGFDKGHYHK